MPSRGNWDKIVWCVPKKSQIWLKNFKYCWAIISDTMISVDKRLDKNKDALEMLGYIETLPKQFEEGIKIAESVKPPEFDPENIIVGGMGGSAISGDILASLLFRRTQMPIHVNRSPFLPTFVGKKTLAFIMSYSGNTEETLKMYEEALKKGAYIVAISSGGKLQKLAKKHGHDHIPLPQGLPPRSAIGYMLVPVLLMLKMMKIYDPDVEINDAIHVMKELGNRIGRGVAEEKNEAKMLARMLYGKIPVIYGHTFYSSVARRWHTQFNENSKVLSWWGTIPEMLHNEVEGWAFDRNRGRLFVVLLRDKAEEERIKKYTDIFVEIMRRRKMKYYEVWCEGETYLGKIMYGIYFGDVVSIYLAVLRNLSPKDIPTIREVKDML
ncbi:MAG: bifunctional phosphoglucose/phosphomannose isomerase [Thermoplasmata archaeon]|nr:MAG: bifunctional phosphoglucose/phosphomannose isomerase [Thermoplasmata archaeon]